MKRFQLSYAIVTAFLVAACSNGTHQAPTGLTAAASVSAPPIIDVQPLTISFRGQPIARLFADGRTESVGPLAPGENVPMSRGPILHPDGTIEMTTGGVTARIDVHGDIYVVAPPGTTPREQLFGHIEGDQMKSALSHDAWDVRVEGNIIEFGEQNSSQIDGEVTPSMRHTALVMAAAFTIDGAVRVSTPDAGE